MPSSRRKSKPRLPKLARVYLTAKPRTGAWRKPPKLRVTGAPRVPKYLAVLTTVPNFELRNVLTNLLTPAAGGRFRYNGGVPDYLIIGETSRAKIVREVAYECSEWWADEVLYLNLFTLKSGRYVNGEQHVVKYDADEQVARCPTLPGLR